MQKSIEELKNEHNEENIEISAQKYLIKFYKSKTAYYYVSNWTMSNFKDDHIFDMKRITNSIKEL